MSQLTADINTYNIGNLRDEIKRKTSSYPYLANKNTAQGVITDMDHTPYTRWFRGVYYYPEPIIMEREAGYRPIRNSCYNLVAPPPVEQEPQHCFEAPCTTIYPCVPKFTRYSDKEVLDAYLNKNFPILYR